MALGCDPRPAGGPAAHLEASTFEAGATQEVPGAPGLVLEQHVTHLLDSRVLDPVPIDVTRISGMAGQGRTFRFALRWRQ